MEGVVVSAKKDGATITVSVVSDDKGHFNFTASRLDPGNYAISTRAAGYDLDGPKEAAVASGQDTKVDVKLKPTRNLSAQMSNAEWLSACPVPTTKRGWCSTAIAATRWNASCAQPTMRHFASASARSLKRWILPVAVFGSSRRNSIQRGYL